MFAKPAYAAAEHASNIVAGTPGDGFYITSEMLTMWVLSILIVVVAIIGTRNMKRVPTGLQNVLETFLELLEDQIAGIMGKTRARKYGPFLMTFFIFIFVSNYSGLLPLSGMVTGFKAPTSNLSTTAGLAIIVIVSYFVIGLRDNTRNFLKFFFSPMLPINLLEAVTRPLSLAVRLYGNIFGEEMVIFFFFSLLPFFLPLPMYILGLLFGLIQAYVFTLLASVYIDEATREGH